MFLIGSNLARAVCRVRPIAGPFTTATRTQARGTCDTILARGTLKVMQRTVVILKPDALQRGLVGEIIHRFERKGLKLVGLKMTSVTDALLEEHYVHHKDKPFFAELKRFMMSSPLVCMLWEGIEAISVARKMAGATNSREAELGSIRGDFSMSTSANIIHVSDSAAAAREEEARFFDKNEIFEWETVISPYLYSEDEK